MRAAREAWFEGQLDLDPDAVVFIDETATATNMARTYGRAPRGERCRLLVPQGHYKTTTVTAALRTSGLVATTLFDGATNGARFRAYVTDTLVPVLKPGDTVILDNLQSHKVVGVSGCETSLASATTRRARLMRLELGGLYVGLASAGSASRRWRNTISGESPFSTRCRRPL